MFNCAAGVVDFGAVSDSDGGLAEAAALATLRFGCSHDTLCTQVQWLKYDLSHRLDGDIAISPQACDLLD